jgi:hypothetical protein
MCQPSQILPSIGIRIRAVDFLDTLDHPGPLDINNVQLILPVFFNIVWDIRRRLSSQNVLPRIDPLKVVGAMSRCPVPKDVTAVSKTTGHANHPHSEVVLCFASSLLSLSGAIWDLHRRRASYNGP